MGIIHGFERTGTREIPELRTRAESFVHLQTGAELLSLMNDDENKVFGITFRTPPADSTGIPHILEHSVLCGSRKYPVKEPFVELLKGSLQTFLNAMTYPDKTCYPVASQNKQDFYNLIDVYLDAVFYPRLTPFVLQQEGWHLEKAEGEDRLILRGVVFSEMKGAHSSPDSLLAETSRQSLFPESPYGFDAGGDPAHIPSLTFEQFRAFHQRYYHPSNARIYFYGDDEPERRLSLVNDYLKDFQRIRIDSRVGVQTAFQEPKRITRPFAAGEGQSASKGLVTLNWLLEEPTRVEQNLGLHMLEYILLGMPGSPLRKALIDSGYGEDLAGQGLEGEIRQMYLSTGLKGIDPDDAGRVESLILETLGRLVKEGIDPRTVEAAVNTLEFALRENNTGSYPRGLVLMLRALTTWLYDHDPLDLIAFEDPLERVKSRIRSEKTYFESMIDRYLLNNPHRTLVLLKPDPELGREEEEAERARIGDMTSSMESAQVQEILATSARLKELQGTPDPPEALAAIPCLRLSDLSRTNKSIPLATSDGKEPGILYHDFFTSGILYLDLGFNIHVLPQRLLPYLPLFGRALLEVGTEEEDFVSLSQRISGKTGGISPNTHASAVKDSREGAVWLFLRGKAMLSRTPELLGILRDVLLKVRFDNRERFRQMVMESKARREQNLLSAGHQMVNLRLRSHYDEASWAAEQMKGVSQLLFLRDLGRAVDEDWPRVLSHLEEMRSLVLNRSSMLVNATLDEEGWRDAEPRVREFLAELPGSAVTPQKWSMESPHPFEGLTVPTQVNYVGKALSLYGLGYRFHGSAHVITRYLRNAWLWDRVRVQGGAYGAFCLLDRLTGVLTFVSYRDPNLQKTIEAFDQAAGFLEGLELREEERVKAIIGAIGDIDQYQLPDAKGYTSMARYLSGETDEERQQMRDEVLGTGLDDFRSFGAALRQGLDSGLVKVLGSQAAVDEVQASRPGWLKVTKLL
ncbi:MAG: insulinase family protein [Thermodesulfobacteriota bacterium]